MFSVNELLIDQIINFFDWFLNLCIQNNEKCSFIHYTRVMLNSNKKWHKNQYYKNFSKNSCTITENTEKQMP